MTKGLPKTPCRCPVRVDPFQRAGEPAVRMVLRRELSSRWAKINPVQPERWSRFAFAAGTALALLLLFHVAQRLFSPQPHARERRAGQERRLPAGAGGHVLAALLLVPGIVREALTHESLAEQRAVGRRVRRGRDRPDPDRGARSGSGSCSCARWSAELETRERRGRRGGRRQLRRGRDPGRAGHRGQRPPGPGPVGRVLRPGGRDAGRSTSRCSARSRPTTTPSRSRARTWRRR